MDILQPMAAVVLVLALLGGALFVLRKRGAAAFSFSRLATGPRRMQVLERLPLGPQHALHIVRLGRRAVVVATAPTSCQLLCEVETLEVEA